MLHNIPSLPQLEGLADTLMEQVLESWRTSTAVERKSDGSLVTPVDKAANLTAMKWARGFDIGFVGEEGSDTTITNDFVLYVDPLDGTSTYIAGKTEFSVILTLMRRDGARWKPEICIIAEPVSGLKYCATATGVQVRTKGGQQIQRLGSLRNHEGPFHVSVITWRNVPYRLGNVRNTVETHQRLHHHGCGNTGINGPLISLGSMDGVVYAGKCATESAAISLMVRAVGGVVIDFDGQPLESFEMKCFEGKLDFELPRGMIAAGSPMVAGLLLDTVKSHQ